MYDINLGNLNKLKYSLYSFPSFNKLINIDSELGEFDMPRLMYNFDGRDGTLKDGLGLSDIVIKYNDTYVQQGKTLELPSNGIILDAWYFDKWNIVSNETQPLLLVMDMDHNIYYNMLSTSFNTFTRINNLRLTSNPVMTHAKIGDKDTLILYSESDGMLTWSGDTVVNIPTNFDISSMCVHNGRLFATINGEKRTIVFSETLNLTNFEVTENQGGYINMFDDYGKCNRVIVFGENVYVIRDYNIAKITSYKNSSDLVIEQISVGNSLIYPNSVCVCGNKIIYLTSDGLYEFDGNKSKKIIVPFEELYYDVDNEYAYATYNKGVYYLACRLNYNDSKSVGYVGNYEYYKNNSMIALDVNSGNVRILRGYDIEKVVSIGDSRDSYTLAIHWTNRYAKITLSEIVTNGAIHSDSIDKCWSSKNINFGHIDKKKLLKELFIETHKDIILNIYYDDKLKSIKIKGKSKIQKIILNLCAMKFRFEINSNETGNYIANVQVRVGIL